MKEISINTAAGFDFDFEKYATKEDLAMNFLLGYRSYLLKNGLAEFGDLIPSKKDLAGFLKISTGTVANAIKNLETRSLFSAKQCIGTTIADENSKSAKFRVVSKKDRAVAEIQKFLIHEKYEENEFIPSIGTISTEIKISANTVRLAVFELIETGILRREIYRKKPVLVINSKEKLYGEKPFSPDIRNKNLAKILKESIKKFVQQNCRPGDKIPTNKDFSKMYNVSPRTIHLAISELNKEKIILSRRGAYGSVYIGAKNTERSIFMSKPKGKNEIVNSYNYKWEYALENMKKFILKNYEAGDKIPAIKDLAKMLNVSTTTVKKAADTLIKQGIIFVQKGRYGGLFIMEMPEKNDAYQWVAINPDYFENKN